MLIHLSAGVPVAVNLDSDSCCPAEIMFRGQVNAVPIAGFTDAKRGRLARLITIDIETDALCRTLVSAASNEQQ
jgi:hypothetical protein